MDHSLAGLLLLTAGPAWLFLRHGFDTLMGDGGW